MSAQVEIGSLRDRIEEARRRQEEERVEVAVRKMQKARERLKAKMLSVLAIHIEDADITVLGFEPFVAVEGFGFTVDVEGALVNLRKCDHCGERYQRLTYSVSSLADTFIPYPHNEGFCLTLAAQTERPKTTKERLIEALRDFIAENSGQG